MIFNYKDAMMAAKTAKNVDHAQAWLTLAIELRQADFSIFSPSESYQHAVSEYITAMGKCNPSREKFWIAFIREIRITNDQYDTVYVDGNFTTKHPEGL